MFILFFFINQNNYCCTDWGSGACKHLKSCRKIEEYCKEPVGGTRGDDNPGEGVHVPVGRATLYCTLYCKEYILPFSSSCSPCDTLETPVPPHLIFLSSSSPLFISVNSFSVFLFNIKMKDFYRTLMWILSRVALQYAPGHTLPTHKHTTSFHALHSMHLRNTLTRTWLHNRNITKRT